MIIQGKNIRFSYGVQEVLHNITLNIDTGEFLGIIGPNGSGKTTLLNCLSGILPASGNIYLEEKDIRQLNRSDIARKLAFVSSENFLNYDFTVEEIVMMGRNPWLGRFQMEGEKDYQYVKEAIEITGLSNIYGKPVKELSSGERQLVFLARALAQKTEIIFLDEPIVHLDISHQINILNLLKRLNRQNSLTIVAILHDLNLASEYCHRLVLLKDGSIYRDGSPAEVLTYQNIEKVYRTVVLVTESPVSRKPHIVPVPEENTSFSN